MTPLDHLCSTLLLDQADTWDQPNRVFLIHRTGLGTLTLTPVDLPEEVHYASPSDQLDHFLATTSLDLVRSATTVSDATRGVAVMYEAWEAPPSHAEELWRRHQAGGSTPSVADIPGRCEVRMLWARTTDGHTSILRLTRGNTTPDVASHSLEGTGEVTVALRRTVTILDRLRDQATVQALSRAAQQATDAESSQEMS